MTHCHSGRVSHHARSGATKYHKVGRFFLSARPGLGVSPLPPQCSHVWRMNSCWLQSSTRHNEKFPVGSHQPSQSAGPDSFQSLQAALDHHHFLGNIKHLVRNTPGTGWSLVVCVVSEHSWTQKYLVRPTGNISEVIWVIIEQSDPVAAVKC